MLILQPHFNRLFFLPCLDRTQNLLRNVERPKVQAVEVALRIDSLLLSGRVALIAGMDMDTTADYIIGLPVRAI